MHTLEFTTPGSATTVRFSSQDTGQWGPAIDSSKVGLVSTSVPETHALAFAAVTPDPVRAGGRMAFTLATAGRARLAVYDVQGREQALLADDTFGAGTHSLEFAPRAWGARPGLYLAVLSAGGRIFVRRFTVLS